MRMNKYLSRLQRLLDLIKDKEANSSLDKLSICGAHLSEVLSDLETCINHCMHDVDYTPPAYYLKQLNKQYKHYNSKTYAS